MTASSVPFSRSRTVERPLPPVVAVVGLSESGKTTLLTALIPEIGRYGLRVGTIKHHPHDVEMDAPGKDTWRHRRAGASGTVLSTPSAIGLIRSADHDHTPEELAGFLADMDIVLAEGYKGAEVPKIEVHRPDLSARPLCLNDPYLLALVTPEAIPASSIPRFDPGDTAGLAGFLVFHFKLRP